METLEILRSEIKAPPSGAGGAVWSLACSVSEIPEDGGACVLINGEQIAIYNFARRGEWYATQNL